MLFTRASAIERSRIYTMVEISAWLWCLSILILHIMLKLSTSVYCKSVPINGSNSARLLFWLASTPCTRGTSICSVGKTRINCSLFGELSNIWLKTCNVIIGVLKLFTGRFIRFFDFSTILTSWISVSSFAKLSEGDLLWILSSIPSIVST